MSVRPGGIKTTIASKPRRYKRRHIIERTKLDGLGAFADWPPATRGKSVCCESL
jgi:hypothetical protein